MMLFYYKIKLICDLCFESHIDSTYRKAAKKKSSESEIKLTF